MTIHKNDLLIAGIIIGVCLFGYIDFYFNKPNQTTQTTSSPKRRAYQPKHIKKYVRIRFPLIRIKTTQSPGFRQPSMNSMMECMDTTRSPVQRKQNPRMYELPTEYGEPIG